MASQSATDAARDLVVRMYAAAAAGEKHVLAEVLAPDFTVEEPNFLPYGGRYQGLAEFAALFARVSMVIDLSRLKLDGVSADGDIVYGRVRAPLVDGDGYAEIVEEWRVRDGRVAAARVFRLNDPSS